MAQSQLQRFLERALAFAQVALESPTVERLRQVRDYLDVLGRVERLQMTLAEARQIVVLLQQLRLLTARADQQLLALVARN
jgi:hypothetical protein